MDYDTMMAISMIEEVSDEGLLPKDRLSEIVDQNGDHFILASDNTIDFGVLRSGGKLPEAPLRLSSGNSENGFIHIEKRHGYQIRDNGWMSVLYFIEYVSKNYTVIKLGEANENDLGCTNQTYLLQLTDEHNNTLYVQLSRNTDYYNINSAGVFRKGYGINKKTLWSASEVQNSGSATTDNALQSEPDAEEGSTSNGTASNVSEVKDREK